MTLAYWIASGGGIGRFPFAPGTVASLAAVPIGAAALWCGPFTLPLLTLATILIGTWAIHATREAGDPGWIVIDEFAGQFVSLLGLAHLSIAGLAVAFVLFRLFDIVKPGPVGWADRRHDAIGVMADDVVAGLIVAAILFFGTHLFPQVKP